MDTFTLDPLDVFSPRELARAAGVPESLVRQLIAAGELRTVGEEAEFISGDDALHVGRALASGRWPVLSAAVAGVPASRPLFTPPVSMERSTGIPLVLSSTAHAAIVAGAIFVTTVGLTQTSATTDVTLEKPEPLRLVYLALPGPGGGGGGGGLRQKAPPPKAQRKGRSSLDSPLPTRQPPKQVVPVEHPPEPPKPPPLKAEHLPVVVAPVVVAPADNQDRAGVLEQTTAKADSRGSGEGGGVGSGTGTGLGEGDGSGIGPGSGGGTGGGPYRPGSGIDPPRLLREVKPDYTEEARQRGVEGDVVLEIVVRRDGSVGEIRVMQGLGAGLDQRAIQAVRQWRFAPARRHNVPVDVMVEVAVEFKLR